MCFSLHSEAYRTIPSSTPHTSTPGSEHSSADKNEIFRRAHDASKATDFILALERDKSIGEEDLVSGPVLDAGASGSSPAAMLERETEELHQDRERVEEKEADAALSAADRVNLDSTDNANESARPRRASPRSMPRVTNQAAAPLMSTANANGDGSAEHC